MAQGVLLSPASRSKLARLTALSWAVWLALFGGVGAYAVHRVRAHANEGDLGRVTWHQRYNMCKRLSPAPRPTWQECLVRAQAERAELLAPGTPGFNSGKPGSQWDRKSAP
jgi:hypothetical protein